MLRTGTTYLWSGSVTATVRDNDMNMMNICKNDEERKLRKAIYIGDGGQVTTVSGHSLSGGPERS